MTDSVTLIVAGGESTISADELTIERIIAEAHSVGYDEFSVFCNDKEIEKPEDFNVTPGASYIITPAYDENALNDIEIIEDTNEPE